ncbi:MAG TPA: hypothetical protein VK821_16715, partial [Dehalococcoidia bacterium]|nr:hypothetical protein [Dehalococcoidia bacterium]
MAYDKANGVLAAVVGGRPPFTVGAPMDLPEGLETETWTWDGTVWSQQPAASPPQGGLMCFDESKDEIVLFDAADTWTEDGSTWTEATIPPALS